MVFLKNKNMKDFIQISVTVHMCAENSFLFTKKDPAQFWGCFKFINVLFVQRKKKLQTFELIRSFETQLFKKI